MRDDSQIQAISLHVAVLARNEKRPAQACQVHMDEAAFRVFYDQTSRPLLAYLIRAFGQSALAEDIWQESYCRFLGAEVPAMDDRQARSYLFQIATNLMRDRWRRPGEDPAPPELMSPEPHFESRLQMRQAFQRLKPRERQLLWLAYVEGSSHKEIAASTGLRASSIRLLLFRARRKLADLIGLKPGTHGPEMLK